MGRSLHLPRAMPAAAEAVIAELTLAACACADTIVSNAESESWALFSSRYNCSVLGIVTILIINYGVKQNQFTKSTSEPPR